MFWLTSEADDELNARFYYLVFLVPVNLLLGNQYNSEIYGIQRYCSLQKMNLTIARLVTRHWLFTGTSGMAQLRVPEGLKVQSDRIETQPIVNQNRF